MPETRTQRIMREVRKRDQEHAAWLARPDTEVRPYVKKVGGKEVKVTAHTRRPPGKAEGWTEWIKKKEEEE